MSRPRFTQHRTPQRQFLLLCLLGLIVGYPLTGIACGKSSTSCVQFLPSNQEVDNPFGEPEPEIIQGEANPLTESNPFEEPTPPSPETPMPIQEVPFDLDNNLETDQESEPASAVGQEPPTPDPQDDSNDNDSDNSNSESGQSGDYELTDEDKMSDEELNRELFGEEADKDASAETKDKEDDLLSKEDSPLDEEDESKQRQVNKQSIESYLQNINSLTIDTQTPPPSGLDAVNLPQRISPPQVFSQLRPAQPTAMRYQIPDIYHQPLYFQDDPLERQGIHNCRRQPFESGRKFLGDVFELPKKMNQQHPNSTIYRQNWRYNRPGLLK